MLRVATLDKERCKPDDCGIPCYRFCREVLNRRYAIKFIAGQKKPIIDEDFLADRIMVFKGIPSIEGRGSTPMRLRDAMNFFLAEMGITFRRDPDTKRPRINKPDSKLDKEQKSSGEFYYATATE